jgi:hypothetical protein
MSAEQSFNIHNTFPLPIGASRAEPVSHTQYVQLSRPELTWTELINRQPLVTGTSVLGIKYKDGVMLAADNLGKLAKPLESDQADDSLVRIPCSIQGYSATASSW